MYQLENKYLQHGAFKIADDVISEYSHQNNNVENHDDDGSKEFKPTSVVKAVMNPSNGLPEDEIKDEINTFIAAVIIFFESI